LLDHSARNNNIQILTDFISDVPLIASDQSQLQQVFMNLITNAIDAIGMDGEIHVKSRTSDASIVIDVTDDGPGISPEEQKKVFDPFYTTKEAGKGSGLGLWVSYDIIKKMGGNITVTSTPGEGTTFTVALPVAGRQN
jgi:two-component system NtrC family sensor kinase